MLVAGCDLGCGISHNLNVDCLGLSHSTEAGFKGKHPKTGSQDEAVYLE